MTTHLPRSVRAFSSAALAALLLASPAWARKKKKQPPPPPPAAKPEPAPPPLGPTLLTVAVPASPGSTHWVPLLQAAGDSAVAKAKHNEPVSLADAFDSKGAAVRAAALKDGRAQLKAARSAFGDHDVDIAGLIADKALAKLVAVDWSEHLHDYLDAWETKIAVLASDPKGMDKARAELAQLLAVDPDRKLSGALFKPETAKLADSMASGVRDSMRLGLTVTTTPPSAEVYVDGVLRGLSPAAVKSLAPGSHYVSVVSPGFKLAQQKVNASDGKCDFKLEPSDPAGAYAAFVATAQGATKAGTLPAAAAKLGTALQVDQVMVMVVDKPADSKGMLHGDLVRVSSTSGQVLNEIKDNLSDSDSFFNSAAEIIAGKALADSGAAPAAASAAPAVHPAPAPAPAAPPAAAPPPPPAKPAQAAAPPPPPPAQSQPAPPPPASKPTPPPAQTAAATPAPTPPAESADSKRKAPADLGDDIKE